ncbi:Cof-type HAD-IIB family hydrolase [Limosilactobacillus panis]|jgi:Cof subfamily protein (haloacid dehalogenase superfamily)|uniref:Cof-type HAD-IIB family hydrolase n=1 Tax=Limosilactobacillus panis TaxID=47493 RepID=UPI001C950ADF|nr:Cof-type HAD-IIB family hydrolase [Limosilactobacillus panis]QZN93011.1 Cof-type HAD-IIB family hydrolase [Limosilactobacillus panis]
MIRAVATDIDGTFLRQDRTYDRKLFAQVYAAMQAQRARLIIASGDQYYFLRSLFPDQADQLAYVAENGVLTIDQNEELACDRLSAENVRKITTYLDTLPGINYCASGRQYVYVLNRADDNFKRIIPNFYTRIKTVDDVNNVDDDFIFKFALNVPHDQQATLIHNINTRFTGIVRATASGYGAVDLIIPGMDKSYGLKLLLKRWHLTPADLAVFGDGENDLEMFDLANTSYAMGNAPANVQAAATQIIGTNNDQAVLHQLAEIFLP